MRLGSGAGSASVVEIHGKQDQGDAAEGRDAGEGGSRDPARQPAARPLRKSDCTASARRRISSPKSRVGRVARCSPLPALAMLPRKPLRGNLARLGPAAPRRSRRSRSIPQSSRHRSRAPVPAALSAVRKGGRVVGAGIHMSDIPELFRAGCSGRSGNFSRSPISREVTATSRMGRLQGAAVLVR